MKASARGLEFRIEGMDCAEEVATLKRELAPLLGENRLSFDILNAKMTVQPGTATDSPERIIAAVKRTGMRAEPWSDASQAEEFAQDAGARRTLMTIVSGLCLGAGFTTHAWLAGGLLPALGSEGMGLVHGVPLSARALYGLGILAGSWLILPKAWFAAKHLRPGMNLLMTVAVVGAAGIGEWFEAATVSFLFSLALLLES